MAVTLGVAGGPELRGAGYTDAVLGAYIAGATATGVRAAAVAGVQIAAGARGAVPGVASRRPCRAPARAAGRRRRVRRDRRGRPRHMALRAASGRPVRGVDRAAVAAEVVNVRLNADSYRPWEGIAPLSRAASSGELYARLSHQLGDEAAVVVARVFPQPQGSGQSLVDQLRAGLTAGGLPGRLAMPETTTPVSIKLRRMGGIDAAGRARALHVLTEAGYTNEQAADLLGWD